MSETRHRHHDHEVPHTHPMASGAAWDESAEGYARIAEGFTGAFCHDAAAALLPTLAGQEKPVVLDVASGTGEAILALGRMLPKGQAAKLIANDISTKMLDIMWVNVEDKPLPAEVELVTQHDDATWLDGVPDMTVDGATVVFGLMFIPDPLQALRSIARVMKPGATAVIMTWHWVRMMEIMAVVAKDQGKQLGDAPTPIVRFSDEGALRHFFADEGLFEVKDIRFVQHERPMDIDALVDLFEASPVFVKLRPWDKPAMKRKLSEFAEADGKVLTRGTSIMNTIVRK